MNLNLWKRRSNRFLLGFIMIVLSKGSVFGEDLEPKFFRLISSPNGFSFTFSLETHDWLAIEKSTDVRDV